jgi:hypothetical protein
MRLNVKQPVLDYEGNPLLANKTNPDGSAVIGEDGRPVREPETLRSYLVTALNNKTTSEHEPVPAEEAAKRYQLSVKLYAKNDVDLTLAEATLLQERVGKLYGDMPLIVGRIGDVLEGTSSPVPAADKDGGE